MVNNQVNCQYIEDNNCKAITENVEAKEVRHLNCNNDNENACCYLCDNYFECEISCNFLGEKTTKISGREPIETSIDIKTIIKCSRCQAKMRSAKVNLRMGGWSGLAQLFPFGSLGELGEELLPVIVFVCPKCGKLEFFAEGRTAQTIMDR